MLLVRLATDVEWTEEAACFEGIAFQIAECYSELPQDDADADADADADNGGSSTGRVGDAPVVSRALQEIVQHIWYPAFRYCFIPPQSAGKDGSVMQLADLKDLYRIFERC